MSIVDDMVRERAKDILFLAELEFGESLKRAYMKFANKSPGTPPPVRKDNDFVVSIGKVTDGFSSEMSKTATYKTILDGVEKDLVKKILDRESSV